MMDIIGLILLVCYITYVIYDLKKINDKRKNL